jgi:hypothetical protein
MSSITIHNLDSDLERVIRETAESQHTSLKQRPWNLKIISKNLKLSIRKCGNEYSL